MEHSFSLTTDTWLLYSSRTILQVLPYFKPYAGEFRVTCNRNASHGKQKKMSAILLFGPFDSRGLTVPFFPRGRQIAYFLLATVALAAANPQQVLRGNLKIKVSRDEWSRLNPYGADPSSYPPHEREEIAEIQKQWEKFYDFLP